MNSTDVGTECTSSGFPGWTALFGETLPFITILGIVEWLQMRVRFFNIWALLVILSMAVSAVAACACSHHKPAAAAVESTSCHGPSHEMPTSATNSPDLIGDQAGADCKCFVRDPVPAISAKPGTKKAADVLRSAESLPYLFQPEAEYFILVPPVVGLNISPDQSSPPLASGPSRAPPRI